MTTFFCGPDADWLALPKEEQDRLIENEFRVLWHQITMVEEGLAFRMHGLIYFVPLCHDAFGEGNA